VALDDHLGLPPLQRTGNGVGYDPFLRERVTWWVGDVGPWKRCGSPSRRAAARPAAAAGTRLGGRRRVPGVGLVPRGATASKRALAGARGPTVSGPPAPGAECARVRRHLRARRALL